ncbi:MAG: hypothetical protein ACR5LF_06160 [Symbiopectobacterium sp.]
MPARPMLFIRALQAFYNVHYKRFTIRLR